MPISLPRWLAEQFEADQRRFIPYAGHIMPNVVMNTDASVTAMLAVHGTPFELTAPLTRNARRDRCNTLLRTIGDIDTSIGIHLVRSQGASPAPQAKAKGSFVRTLMGDYARVALGGLYTNR